MSEFPLQVTIKPPATAGSAPWINFQANNQDEMVNQILEAFPTVGNVDDSLSNLVAQAYLEYAAVLTAAIGLSAPVPAQNAAPQAEARPDFVSPSAASVAPPAPQCGHGEMAYRTGITNKPGTPNHGKEWKGWFCSAPQGTPDNQKCPKQWIR